MSSRRQTPDSGSPDSGSLDSGSPGSGLCEQLRDGRAFAAAGQKVEYLQTHISHLFFLGDRVYKVKKAVDLGFLDFSTLERRRHFCEQELRLNRRLAADVYLGVVQIQVYPDGRLRVDSAEPGGEVVDYAVKMRRLPGRRMLDVLLDVGDVDNLMMRNLAELLSRFHAAAATGHGVDEHGSLAAVRANCLENFTQTQGFTVPGGTISPRLHRFLGERSAAFLDAQVELFDSRVQAGRIRDGHGDLHAGNICMLDDSVVIYDCLEFSTRLRCCDVAADLAFLLMDLDRCRYRGFASYLQREYVRNSGDQQLDELVGFYKGYRAMVRGKVESMGLADRDGEEREAARSSAMGYFHLAASYQLPPSLLLCCGLPGSGKSFAARHLGRPFEAVVLNSDTRRKQAAGVAANRSMPAAVEAGIYTVAASDHTYQSLLDLAETELRRGRTVVVDAGFRSLARRRPFLELASALALPVVVVHVDTAEAIALARLEQRQSRGDSVSDAGVEIYRSLAQGFEAPTEIDASRLVRYDGEASTAELTAQVIDGLIAQV